MKRKKAIDFLLVTLFAGILLTFTVIIGLTDYTDSDNAVSFNGQFHSNSVLNDFVRYFDYKVFKHIDEGDLLIGEDEWLFEAIDSENGYERLLDYIGGNTFTERELNSISDTVAERAAAYKAEGVEYMLIVIPDSITVCSDKVPWYLGAQSENTRLAQVTAELSERGVEEFINPTEAMIAESGDILMYNNTENSINAYGAYCIYNVAVSRFLAVTGRDVERIYREDIDFYTRLTDGKYIAQKVGLSRTVKNRTVSISDGMNSVYEVVYNDKKLVITERGGDEARGVSENVLIEYTHDWDRVQLMPYFSNTFDKVYYSGSISEQANVARQYNATLVVQIIHESELDSLVRNITYN